MPHYLFSLRHSTPFPASMSPSLSISISMSLSASLSVSVLLSLQPWRRYRTDGVILFSDILTPLPGMGVDFTIREGTGPALPDPYRTPERVASISRLDPATATPFVGETLRNLRKEIGRSVRTPHRRVTTRNTCFVLFLYDA